MHPPRWTARAPRAVCTIAGLALISGCGTPEQGQVHRDPVDYLAVFAAQHDAVRTLTATTPAPQTAEDANRALGWDTGGAPYRTVTLTWAGPDRWTVCTREVATGRHVTRSQDGDQIRYRFAVAGCPTGPRTADAELVTGPGADPDVAKGAAHVGTVLEHLDDLQGRAAAGTQVDTAATTLVAALDAEAADAGRYPGAAAEDLPDTVDVDLPAGVYVAEYTPSGVTAQVCVADRDTGAFTVYSLATNRDPVRVRGGNTGPTC